MCQASFCQEKTPYLFRHQNKDRCGVLSKPPPETVTLQILTWKRKKPDVPVRKVSACAAVLYDEKVAQITNQFF
jgi:hypothetical protein